MADNITLNSGSGGATLAADDVTSVWYQRIKLTDGTADSTTVIASGDGTATNALRVTVASDSSPLSVDDNGGSLTVDGTVTATLAATVTEDAASAGGESCILIAGVRNDAAASKTSLDGDFGNIAIDSAGRVGIADLGGSITVDGTVAVSGTVAVTDNAGSLTVDNSTLAVVGGGTEATAMRVTIASDSTGVLSIDDNGGSLTVDGSVNATCTNAGTFAVQESGAALTALQLIDNPVVVDDAAFTPATTSVMMAGFEFDDVTPDSVNEGDAGAARMSANRCQYVMIRDNAGNERGLNIDASGQLAVTNAGTFAVQATLQASTNTTEVVGDAAHDAAVAGNPLRIAGRAVSADYTSVATGDTADLITTLGGKLVTHPYAIPENYVSGATSDMTATTSTSVVAAAGAGLRNYITHLQVQNSHATVGTWVNIQDGSGGTTLYTVYAAAAGGGASITLPCPIKTTANTALYCANVTTGANTRVSASGYKAP